MASDLCNVLKAGASVNFYMLHGGTNFGFMAGANWFKESHYRPDVTSYGIFVYPDAQLLTPWYTDGFIQIDTNKMRSSIKSFLDTNKMRSSIKSFLTSRYFYLLLITFANSFGPRSGPTECRC